MCSAVSPLWPHGVDAAPGERLGVGVSRVFPEGRVSERQLRKHDAQYEPERCDPPGGSLDALADPYTNTGSAPFMRSAGDTETEDGLVRLVVAGREIVGAVVVRAPCAWVYRAAFLRVEDIE